MPATIPSVRPRHPALRTLLLALGLILLLAALLIPVAAPGLEPPPLERGPLQDIWWGSSGGWDGWQARLMILWPVLALLAAVGVVAIGLAVYYSLHPAALPGRSPYAAAHRILATRFARGEIDAQEYAEKLKVLRKPWRHLG